MNVIIERTKEEIEIKFLLNNVEIFEKRMPTLDACATYFQLPCKPKNLKHLKAIINRWCNGITIED